MSDETTSPRWDDDRQRALRDPEGFWADAAEAIEWERRWDRVLDREARPHERWFTGARLNTCFNAVDRHVRDGRGEQVALIHDSAMTGASRTYTYRRLLQEAGQTAGALRSCGVGAGDRVIIYMPAIPEAIIAMLACARLGAVHSVVFGGFAASELATRIAHAAPTAIVSASCGLEPGRIVNYKPMLDEAIELSGYAPRHCLIVQRDEQRADLLPERDLDWAETVASSPMTECVTVAATDPLYTLYTSGTTGQPKAVVRDNGGHAVALRYSMDAVYGVQPGQTFWAASDLGWQVGHSYITYGPLLHGCTTVLYEGKPTTTPDAGAFWRVCADHQVSVLFTAPTAIRVIRQADPAGDRVREHDLTGLQALFLAGERCDTSTWRWATEQLRRPVIDHWWQTESGWPMVANCQGLGPVAIKPGSPGKPVPGFEVRIVDSAGRSVAPGTEGSIVVRRPLPPGALITLWRDDDRFTQHYLGHFPGYYESGDSGSMDEDGYLRIAGRTDDVINVAGHRLSTGAIEEVVASHPAVVEAAVFGAADELKGEVPVALVVVDPTSTAADEDISAEVAAMVRDVIGPVAAVRQIAVVPRLPKTRSGKTLRRTVKSIADGSEWQVPPTIEDPAALDDVTAALRRLGYPRKAKAGSTAAERAAAPRQP